MGTGLKWEWDKNVDTHPYSHIQFKNLNITHIHTHTNFGTKIFHLNQNKFIYHPYLWQKNKN